VSEYSAMAGPNVSSGGQWQTKSSQQRDAWQKSMNSTVGQFIPKSYAYFANGGMALRDGSVATTKPPQPIHNSTAQALVLPAQTGSKWATYAIWILLAGTGGLLLNTFWVLGCRRHKHNVTFPSRLLG